MNTQQHQSEHVQEPVAWMDRDGDLYANEPDRNWCPPHYPLYTTPPAAQSPYQPITTAPKDGTAIFVLLQGSDIPMPVRWKEGEWVTTWDGYRVSEFDEPTHWMAIPRLKGGEA